jgi:hypothetical protein
VCDSVQQNILIAKFKRDKYFVDEVEAAKPMISTIQKTKLVTKQ